VISLIKLDFLSENCQEPLMVVKANHEASCRKSSVFYIWPFTLFAVLYFFKWERYILRYSLLQSATSLVSSSNTWYLRVIKGESWSGHGNGCHRRYCQVMTEGRDHLSFYWRMSLITKLRLAKVEGGIHNNEENTLLNFQSSLWCRIQDPFLIPSPPAAGGIIFLLILFILMKSRTFCTSWCWVF
jgi:hypothetical protein